MNRQQRRRLEKMSQKEFMKIQKETLKKLNKDFPALKATEEDLKNLKETYLKIAEIEAENFNPNYKID